MKKKIVLISLILCLVALYFILGIEDYFTLGYIKESQERLYALYTGDPFRFIGGFCLIYIIVVSLNLPGAAVLGLAAGAIFGVVKGTVIISFISSISATAGCFIARYIFRDFIVKKFPEKIARVNRGVESEGGYYLLTLRLIPLFPFFITNMAMGLTAMPFWKFYAVSQLGMLPGTILFVNAGSELGKIHSVSEIISPSILVSLVLIGILPVIGKKILLLIKAKREKNSGKEPLHGSIPNIKE